MATSNIRSFNPAAGSLFVYALGHVGVRRTAVLAEHLNDAYMAGNLVLQDWSNDQPLLWDTDLVSVALAQGDQVITCPADTILVVDAYISTPTGGVGGPDDRIITGISRTEYASYPNKLRQAQPTVFWFDRGLTSTLTLYPLPDGNGPYTLNYWRFRSSQDTVIAGGLQVAIPPRWLMAYVDAVALELSFTYKPEASSTLAIKLNGGAPGIEGSYNRARRGEREDVPFFISPGLSSYFE